jgi:phospholipid/cholesterol/gamma-HCH transport system permease protein
MRDHTATAEPVPVLVDFGQMALSVLAYLGAWVLLGLDAVRAVFQPKAGSPGLVGAVIRQFDTLLIMGVPLVGLAHVGLGSFLAMQAYYGATFVEAVGPVVGTGLLRNLAPLIAGLTLAGIVSCRFATELRGSHDGLDRDPHRAPDRDASRTVDGAASSQSSPDPARLVAVRVLASMLVGPPLALWGAFVGIGVGAIVAQAKLGVPFAIFYSKFVEMVWPRDMLGLVLKGAGFAVIAALFACHEGLRRRPNETGAWSSAPFRAACFSVLLILVLNNTWFTLAYLAGPAFGPTVLAPPPR